jgi:tetratricopeptide (TPR) repeat protein
MLAFLKQRLPPIVSLTDPMESPEAARPGTAGERLQTILLRAAEATGAGLPFEAAALYREARALCRAEQLALEEAAVLMALGGACMAAQVPALAAESYEDAAHIAEARGEWTLACQAWLGTGGADLSRKHYLLATYAYRAAAAAAQQAQIVPLRIEALRMLGSCLLHLGHDGDAMLAWREAVDVGAEVAVVERGVSGLAEVARALVELLRRHGLFGQAEHVRSLVTESREGEDTGPLR